MGQQNPTQQLYMVGAYVKPFKLDDIKEELTSIGVVGMTVLEVRGFGRQKGHSELYRGGEYTIDFLPKVKIEVIVGEAMRDKVVEAILISARTGSIGDGMVYTYPIVSATKIRDRQPYRP